MIKEMYSKELAQAYAICNEKEVVVKFASRLTSDLNAKAFLDDLHQQAAQYDQMSDVEKSSFNRKFESESAVFFDFERLLTTSSIFGEKSASELIKHNGVFPESLGRSVMFMMGYFPVLRAMKKKVSYEAMLSKSPEKLHGHLKKRQEQRLFGTGFGYRPLLEPTDCVDYDLWAKKVEHERKKYLEEHKPELDNAIALLNKVYEQYDVVTFIHNTAIVETGMQYWDQVLVAKRERNTKMGNAFKGIIDALASASDNEESKAEEGSSDVK